MKYRYFSIGEYPRSGTPERGLFTLNEADLPELDDGQVRVRNTWLSVDPYMRGRMQGFIIFDHWERYPHFLEEVGPLVSADRIDYEEIIIEGLENTPDAFLDLFQGANQGKMLVRL
ncbi:hypothetical protein ACJ7V3_16210 [Halomonas elongata]|uniref:hypothetical protein n=1 Tax=Halomonas elongata TaxID=2746 RepID=UPI0038D3C87E